MSVKFLIFFFSFVLVLGDVSSYRHFYQVKNEIHHHKILAETLINITAGNINVDGGQKYKTYEDLLDFVDRFGNRPSGSESLEKSIDYLKTMIITKLRQYRSRYEHPIKLYTENVEFRPWIRNNESAAIVSPRHQKLNILGLGYSVPTNGLLTAPVLVVKSRQDLRRVGSQAAGTIVVFNQVYQSYSRSVWYRYKGASEASRYGAVAVLIRSITPVSLQTPHTGRQEYDDDVTPIPAASITIEDAELLQRLQDRGENVSVSLYMSCQTLEPVTSRNLVLELEGLDKPDEVVLLAAHVDSWDVGQAAMDNAAGAMVALNALQQIVILRQRLLTSRPTRKNPLFRKFPSRTIRLVFFTAEEIGSHGAKVHYQNQLEAIGNIALAMEMDSGAFKPIGVVFSGQSRAARIMREILQLYKPLNATNVRIIGRAAGSDTAPFYKAGVPTLSLDFSPENYDRYFKYHHTRADTIQALNPDELDQCTAMFAGIAAIVANLDEKLV